MAVDPEREEAAVAALALCGTRGAWCERPGLVRAYFHPRPASDLRRAFRTAWREVAPGDPAPPVEVHKVPPTDWLAPFRRAARPVRVGARLWIAPPGAEPPRGGWPDAAVVVTILPGQGFGTGTHPTTGALLGWLEAEPTGGTVLDVGTGSGILALAALALGARRAVALEVDPAALANARENRALNGARRLALVRGTPATLRRGARFDRVVANLDRRTLEAEVEVLAAAVAPGGRLGVAGLLAGEEPALLGRAAELDLACADHTSLADPATSDRWWSGWLAREDPA